MTEETRARIQQAFLRASGVLHDKAAVEADATAGIFGLRFRFGSPTLAKAYLRSLAPGPAERIDLSIAVLTHDEVDLSYLIPDPPENGRSYINEAHVAVWHADRLPILYLLDRRTRQGIVWLAKGAAPEWELSRPAFPLIHALSLEGPWTTAHGGAIGRDGRCLMLAGKGRAGKSTAALACARAGWDYAGDDYVLANTHSGRIEPLYASARLRVDMAGAFADLLPQTTRGVSENDGDKRHELNLSSILGPARIKGGQLTAILLPRRAGASLPEFTSASRADAFHALFVSTSLGAPAPLKLTAEKLSALVALAPVFFVDTGQQPDAIPDAFADFLAGLPDAHT